MKKKMFILFLFCFQNCFSNNWLTNYEDAQKLSLATNKFIMVDFWATWCGPCKKMDRDTWSNEEIKDLCTNFVLLKIDIDANKEFASKYNVNSIPTVFVIDANGKVVLNFIGYKSPVELKKEVVDYTLSTEYLSSDLINFYKLNNFSNGIRLANKYFDFAVNVEPKIKNAFLDVASDYIKAAKKLLDKKDIAYKEKLQKTDLINLYKYAYSFDFEKLEKKLSNEFVENEITAFNKTHYYFLKSIISIHTSKSVDVATEDKEILEISYAKAKIIYDLSKL